MLKDKIMQLILESVDSEVNEGVGLQNAIEASAKHKREANPLNTDKGEEALKAVKNVKSPEEASKEAEELGKQVNGENILQKAAEKVEQGVEAVKNAAEAHPAAAVATGAALGAGAGALAFKDKIAKALKGVKKPARAKA